VPAEEALESGHLINSQNSVIERRGDRIRALPHLRKRREEIEKAAGRP